MRHYSSDPATGAGQTQNGAAATDPESANPPGLLEVRNLSMSFGHGQSSLLAIDKVSFAVKPGEILGLVGESGSGKSITLRSILGLTKRYGQVEGEILWKKQDLNTLTNRALQKIRGREIAMIFQEPMSSLNPLLTVGLQITENLKAHTKLDRTERKKKAIELLDLVGIPSAAARLGDYPHQFSGGMRQRVMIAIALASEPELLLADEPTTALDVTIQQQILDLILALSREMGMSVIMVTHDLGVAAQTCDRIAVMYGGRLVEVGPVRNILRNPRHPYSIGLLRSVPENVPPRSELYSLPGIPPGLGNRPSGCCFAPRCLAATPRCSEEKPDLLQTSEKVALACFNPQNFLSGNSQ
ncbi:ABC transporter ATP-binding protein [Kiloniella laminariae]|uniref:ABC transporter ATP-binding protein n=1 Tax=Kiloniella laminariae TaxID=454162 RepID=A0ABT4LEE1_9PROT|nr:ABC transporter ATP-binding protein [Kiloniella laminariae]MCZ4279464.1 ABC transporter ATP-binding protein [Kiloniella laminariae]